MPSDDYALSGGGGGALKLKGAKIEKKKKKKRAQKTDLEQNLSTEDSSSKDLTKSEERSSLGPEDRAEDGEGEEGGKTVAQKTESERQYEETRKKRVGHHFFTYILRTRNRVCGGISLLLYYFFFFFFGICQFLSPFYYTFSSSFAFLWLGMAADHYSCSK